MKIVFFFLVVFVINVHSWSFVKGVQNLYETGAEIKVKVRKIESHRNLPFDYYSLKFCALEGVSKESPNEVSNLGELLFGDRVKSTPYHIFMKKPTKCQTINPAECPEKLTNDEIELFQKRIGEEYIVQLMIDRLPVASVNIGDICRYTDLGPTGDEVSYRNVDGYSMGCVSEKKFFLNNHLSFNIKIHEEEEGSSVIAVEVKPASISHSSGSCKADKEIPPRPLLEIHEKMEQPIVWSYSVHFEHVTQRWASRWDNYVQSQQTNIHWYSIINSCLIVLFLSGMIAMIMVRILHKDIAKYNIEDNEPDEKGWKLVHTEVFRPPLARSLFAVFLGSGIQIFGLLFVSLPLAAFGFFSASNRGYFLSAIIVLYFLMGLPAGFFGLRFYKSFEGTRWKLTTFLMGILIPTIVFVCFSVANLVVYFGADSSVAMPFLQLFLLFLLWIGIYVPLVFIGGYLGWRRKPTDFPCQTSKIPRPIPIQPFYLRSFVTIGLGGILPFGSVFVELYFVINSIFGNKLYFFFGFVFLIFFILIIVTAEITIVLVYLQLCNEDYRWWWRSFFTGGFASIYMFFFSIYYFITLHPSSVFLGVVYFGYIALTLCVFFLFLGTIGFISTLLFIKKIYGSIRID